MGSRRGTVQQLKLQQLSRRLGTACTAQIWREDAESCRQCPHRAEETLVWCQVENSRSFLAGWVRNERSPRSSQPRASSPASPFSKVCQLLSGDPACPSANIVLKAQTATHVQCFLRKAAQGHCHRHQHSPVLGDSVLKEGCHSPARGLRAATAAVHPQVWPGFVWNGFFQGLCQLRLGVGVSHSHLLWNQLKALEVHKSVCEVWPRPMGLAWLFWRMCQEDLQGFTSA